MFGLQRAFHLGGAKNVVASLWDVSDQATAALMKVFYHKMYQENMDPLDALQAAQLTLLHSPEHIQTLATRSGPEFKRTVKLVEGGRRDPQRKMADARTWAAFILSGPG